MCWSRHFAPVVGGSHGKCGLLAGGCGQPGALGLRLQPAEGASVCCAVCSTAGGFSVQSKILSLPDLSQPHQLVEKYTHHSHVGANGLHVLYAGMHDFAGLRRPSGPATAKHQFSFAQKLRKTYTDSSNDGAGSTHVSVPCCLVGL